MVGNACRRFVLALSYGIKRIQGARGRFDRWVAPTLNTGLSIRRSPSMRHVLDRAAQWALRSYASGVFPAELLN